MIRAAFVFAMFVVALGVVGQSDYEEEQRQVDEYCSMVELFKQTNGEAGWPAYKGEEVCR